MLVLCAHEWFSLNSSEDVSGFSMYYKLSCSDEDVFMFLAISSQILFYITAAATADELRKATGKCVSVCVQKRENSVISHKKSFLVIEL